MNLSNIIRLHYLAPVIALLCMFVLVGSTLAQVPRPGAPSNVSVVPSDTEAVISWNAPQAGEGGCAPTDYQVWVEKVIDDDLTKGNEVTSPWTATGLEASTNYEVTIYTYSIACDDYSAEPATSTFSTTAADADDAVEPAKKHAPKRARNLRAVKTDGQTDSASLNWNAPRTRGGKHHSASWYAVAVIRVAGDGTKTVIDTIYEITGTETTVDGLTAGNYRFRVAAHNSECNCWGKWRGTSYTHQ